MSALLPHYPQELTFEYQNLAKLSKPEILNLLSFLTEKISRSFIMMGGLLHTIRKNKWYNPDYPNFQDFCDAYAEIQYRKAMYLITIYESLVNNHIPFEEAVKLGYTKLVLLAPYFTQENYESVISWALPLKTLQVETALAGMSKTAKDFIDKVSSASTLEPSYKEPKQEAPELPHLKTYLLTTPLALVVEALNVLHPDKGYVLISEELFA